MKKYLRYIIYIILFSLVLGCFIYLGKKDFGGAAKKMSDAEKFNMEYPDIPKDNNFKYIHSSELLNLFEEEGTHVIFISYSNNEYSSLFVKYLYDVVKKNELDTVYYYNIYKDRSRQTKNYQLIKNKVSNFLISLDNDTKEIYTPLVLIISNGTIAYYNNETAVINNKISAKTYWTEERIDAFEEKIEEIIRGVSND